jgi:hypothetical protein
MQDDFSDNENRSEFGDDSVISDLSEATDEGDAFYERRKKPKAMDDRFGLESIIPWKKVRANMKSLLPKPYLSQILAANAARRPAKPLEVLSNIPSLPITLPHGFQHSRSMACPLDSLVNVIQWPMCNLDTFSCFDSRQAHLWKGKSRVQSQSVVQDNSRKAKPTAMCGLVAWTYIQKWRLLVIANTQLELKILDSNFEELCTKSIEKPALCLEFDDTTDELIVGGVCNIRIWSFRKVAEKGRFVHTFVGPRLVIEDLRNEEWVTKCMLHKLSHKLYAIVDNNVYVCDPSYF